MATTASRKRTAAEPVELADLLGEVVIFTSNVGRRDVVAIVTDVMVHDDDDRIHAYLHMLPPPYLGPEHVNFTRGVPLDQSESPEPGTWRFRR
jgi:hypothetical protein